MDIYIYLIVDIFALIISRTGGNIDFDHIAYVVTHLFNYNIDNASNVLHSWISDGSFIEISLIFLLISLVLLYLVNKYYPILLPVFYGELIGIGIIGIINGAINFLSVFGYNNIHVDSIYIVLIVAPIIAGLAVSLLNIVKLPKYSSDYKRVIQILSVYYKAILNNKVLLMLLLSVIIFYGILGAFTSFTDPSTGDNGSTSLFKAFITLNFNAILSIMILGLTQNNMVYSMIIIMADCILIILAHKKYSKWMPVLYAPLAGFTVVGIYETYMNLTMGADTPNDQLIQLIVIVLSVIIGFVIVIVKEYMVTGHMLIGSTKEKRPKKVQLKQYKDDVQLGYKLSLDDEAYKKTILDLCELSKASGYIGSVAYLNKINGLADAYKLDQSDIIYDCYKISKKIDKEKAES